MLQLTVEPNDIAVPEELQDAVGTVGLQSPCRLQTFCNSLWLASTVASVIVPCTIELETLLHGSEASPPNPRLMQRR